MSILKICHLTSVHSAADPRIFHKECRSLARAGFAVSLVGAHPADAVVDSVQIKSILRDKSRLARMTRTVWRVFREARRQNADVYHFHDPELIPVGLLLQSSGKKVIYDIHEDLPKDILSKPYLPNWSRSIIAGLSSIFERAACRNFSALVAVTPSIALRFTSINHRTVVVHNYPYAKELLRNSEPISWNSRRQSVAYVGGISVQRSIFEMVSAISLVPESIDATLELAGPEIITDSESIKLRAHPGWRHVRHHGFIDQPSTFRILQNVRAGLVLFHPEPNHMEAMPQKIFEYMGAGLPLIASDFPLWRNLLGDLGCAFFVDPMNPREIARAIEFVLTHPSECEEMGRLGQLAVLDRFNWDSEATKLVELYNQIGAELCAA
jgi:glycosyltransferase involved in cell wall biosynthesis